MDISKIFLFNFKSDDKKFPCYYHNLSYFDNEIVCYETFENGQLLERNKIKITNFLDYIVVCENEIFAYFNIDFDRCLNLYNEVEKYDNFKTRIRFSENTYRIFDSKDIEFMKTDLYKKYSNIFNLILGVKTKLFKDDNDDYFFNRYSAYYNNHMEPFFTKISGKDVSRHLMNCEQYSQLNMVFDYYFNLKLSQDEKEQFHNFFVPKIEICNIKVGNYYKIQDKYDNYYKQNTMYIQNPDFMEQLFGICVISYIDNRYVYLHKLDYNDMELRYRFYNKITLDEFIKLKPVKLIDNYHLNIVDILLKLRSINR